MSVAVAAIKKRKSDKYKKYLSKHKKNMQSKLAQVAQDQTIRVQHVSLHKDGT